MTKDIRDEIEAEQFDDWPEWVEEIPEEPDDEDDIIDNADFFSTDAVDSEKEALSDYDIDSEIDIFGSQTEFHLEYPPFSEMNQEQMQNFFYNKICDINPLNPDSDMYRMTDVHASDLYVILVCGHIVWNETTEQWMVYNEQQGIWKENNGAALLYASRIGRAFERYYQDVVEVEFDPEDKEQQALKKSIEGKVKKMMSSKSINAYLTCTKSADRMHIKSSELDADPNVINCLNGELHLDDLQLHDHDPFSFCTKNTGVEYNPVAKSETWDKAIAMYMSNAAGTDPDKLRYFQKAIGYSIDGTQAQKKFFILYGRTTNNGKSTLMNALCNALGDYAKSTSVKAFCSRSRGTDGPSESLANLSGSRFVAAAEAEADWPLDCELLKNITGGDSIMVRMMYGHEFRLVTSFKIWIHSNWIPNMTDPTIFDSGRVVVIPVDAQFTKKAGNLDIDMPEKLQQPKTASAILTWMVDGLREYRTDYSLTPTEEIRTAIAEQRVQANKVAQFVLECLEQIPSCNVSTRNTYIAYRTWCKEMGYSPLNKKRLFDGLKNLDISVKHARNNAPYVGDGNSTNCLAGWTIKMDFVSRCDFTDFR